MADIELFFFTNRNLLARKRPSFGNSFNPDASAGLRYGRATLSNSGADPRVKEVVVYEEQKDPETGLFKIKGSTPFLTNLYRLMWDGEKDTVLYVHGFNVSFEGALEGGARLKRGLALRGRDVNVVVFTWPSDGEAKPFVSYFRDREDAKASGPALGRAFVRVKEYIDAIPPAELCRRRIHIVAHSMGNYLLRHALQYVIGRGTNYLARLCEQVILAAPDEDEDAFEHDHKLALLPRIARQVTVYFSRHDRALTISDLSKSNPDRLGSDGPRLIDLIPKRINLVDAGAFSGMGDGDWPGDSNHHGYYSRSGKVLDDITSVLTDILPDQIPGRTYVPEKRIYRLVAPLT
ncbi:MAG: alpha/beta fold hydrolase [Caulobacteraceae bacterium]|nr:alpha/beta fold hydrolase [Caulobacter sp.]RYF92688.1 MAG: alpha/beta fold hydrolase [Caulobacteraceae bacterium]